jgi:hypothetical protein
LAVRDSSFGKTEYRFGSLIEFFNGTSAGAAALAPKSAAIPAPRRRFSMRGPLRLNPQDARHHVPIRIALRDDIDVSTNKIIDMNSAIVIP